MDIYTVGYFDDLPGWSFRGYVMLVSDVIYAIGCPEGIYRWLYRGYIILVISVMYKVVYFGEV